MDAAARPIDPETLLAHAGRVRALARRLVDDAEADDVVQETLVAAMRTPPRAETPLAPWLSRVARNFSLRALRDRNRRRNHESRAPLPPETASPAESVARAEMFREVVDAVLALEPIYRDVVVARFFDEMEMPDVARRLGVPLETARTRLKRAVGMLRDRLDRKYGDRRAWAVLLVGTGTRGTPRSAARSAAKKASAAAVVGGLLMVKKLLVAAAVLLVVGGAWWALSDDAAPPSAATPRPAETAAARLAAAPHVRAKPEAQPAPAPVAPPVEENKGPRVTGRVVDEAGNAVAGALVVSYPEDAKRFTPREAGAPGSRTYRAKADAQGRFAVRIDENAPIVTVYAEARGRAPEYASEVRPGADVEIRLPPAAFVAGRVMDLEANPIAGAKVSIVELADTVEIAREATSDADGTYRVEGLSASKTRRLYAWTTRWMEVTADGYAPFFVEDGARRADWDFVLVRGATLKGVVTDAAGGAPVADARVVLWSIEGMGGFSRPGGGSLSAPRSPRPLGETRTAADGTYSFAHVPSDGFHQSSSHNGMQNGRMQLGGVAAWKDGWCVAQAEVAIPKDGETVEQPLKLWAAAIVEGTVATADGKPVGNAFVQAKVAGRDERVYVPPLYDAVPMPWIYSTGADGRFRIAGVRASHGAPVQATITATVREGADTSPEVSTTVDVEAGKTATDVRLVVTPVVAPAVVFVVTDAAGAPVSGALVSSVGGWMGGASGRTGFDGRRRLSVVNRGGPKRDAGKPTTFSVKSRGFAPAYVEAVPSVESPPELSVTLAAARRIAGRVERADGSPAANVSVSVMDARYVAPAPRPGQMNDSPEAYKANYGWATTADDGAFAVEDLPEGPYKLTATSYRRVVPGGAGPRLTPAAVTATNVASDASDVRLVLADDDGAGAATPQPLDVEATDAVTGKAVPKFSAWIEGAMPLYAQQVTPGRARFANLPAGAWTIRVQASGYAVAEIVCERAGAGGAPIAVALGRGATVRGVVRAGEALPSPASVTFAPDVSEDEARRPKASVSAPLDSDGAYVARGFTPGRYRVVVSSSDRSGRDAAPFLPADGRTLEVTAADGESVFDVGVVPGARAMLQFDDPRLPEHVSYPPMGTEAQLKFAAGCVIELRDAAGKLLHVQKIPGARTSYVVYVPAGELVATLRAPGDAPRELRVVAKPGGTVAVAFKAP